MQSICRCGAVSRDRFRPSIKSTIKVLPFIPHIPFNGMEELNEARMVRKGLHPFIEDPLLTQGAMACCEYRAKHHMEGHTPNDFAYLPAGAIAKAGGCAALEPEWGWQSCCQYDEYTYGGAAIIIGDDGKRYMHLFVR